MRILSLSAIVVAILGLAAWSSSAQTVAASAVSFTVEATGDQEVNAVTGAGSAVGEFTFDADSKVLTYDIKVFGLSGNLITAAHIHKGAVGVGGPPVFTISMGGETRFNGSITMTDEEVADLEAGEYYYNVHSVEHPGGFARGQLVLPAAAEEPVISPPSTGSGGLTTEADGFRWSWGATAVLAVFAVSIAALAVRKSS